MCREEPGSADEGGSGGETERAMRAGCGEGMQRGGARGDVAVAAAAADAAVTAAAVGECCGCVCCYLLDQAQRLVSFTRKPRDRLDSGH